MKPIITIHPIDEDLRFLKKLVRTIKREYSEYVRPVKLSNTSGSHTKGISIINNTVEGSLICFFCHGRDNALLGCSYRSKYGSHPQQYNHGPFIRVSQANILAGKKIIALACHSNDIGKRIISKGIPVFLGFDEINFDYPYFYEENRPDRHVISLTKGMLRSVISASLLQGISNNLTFYQLESVMKIRFNQASDWLILNHKDHKGKSYYQRAANNLQEIKSGLRVWGDGNITLVS